MHENHCGGYPGKSDEELKEIHKQAIKKAVERYPEAKHFGVWSQGEAPDNIRTDIWLVE